MGGTFAKCVTDSLFLMAQGYAVVIYAATKSYIWNV